jgi:hypothetical protein
MTDLPDTDPGHGDTRPRSSFKTQNSKLKIFAIVIGLVIVLGAGVLLAGALLPRTVRTPPGPGALVLRMDTVPGYTWGAPALANAVHPGPRWSLYGDGTLVYRRDGAWQSGVLDPAAVQGLLRRVVDAERFFDTDPRYIVLPDVGYTTFTLTADGQTHTTRVDGLGRGRPAAWLAQVLNPRVTGPERLARAAALIEGTQPPAPQPYRPAHARLYIDETAAPGTHADPWPFPTIPLKKPADAPAGKGPRIVELTGDLAAQALAFAPAARLVRQDRDYAFVIVVPELP